MTQLGFPGPIAPEYDPEAVPATDRPQDPRQVSPAKGKNEGGDYNNSTRNVRFNAHAAFPRVTRVTEGFSG